MERAEVVNAVSTITLPITIPATGGAVTVLSLVLTAMTALGLQPEHVRFWQIMPRVAAGTDRAAFLLGHSAAAMHSHYSAGTACQQSCTDLSKNFVSSTDVSTVAAVIEVSVG